MMMDIFKVIKRCIGDVGNVIIKIESSIQNNQVSDLLYFRDNEYKCPVSVFQEYKYLSLDCIQLYKVGSACFT